MLTHPSRPPAVDTAEVLELFATHSDLAIRLSRRYGRRDNSADLEQVAKLGLLLAARRYEPGRGPFERFAIVTILGELKKYLRSTGWAVHVPRRVQEDAARVDAAVDTLTAQLHRRPTPHEIATSCGLPLVRVEPALLAREGRYTSFEAFDRGAAEDDLERSIVIRRAVESLPMLSQQVISMTFDRGLSQREVAQRLGISQTRVHRTMKWAFEDLAEQLAGVLVDEPSVVEPDGASPTAA